MKNMFTAAILGIACIGIAGDAAGARRSVNPEAKLHRYSTTVEKERPQLDEETRRLIAAYRRDPSSANYAALKAKVERNYDAVVARKKAKLEELKRTARDRSKVEEMQIIVDEMLRDREQRVEIPCGASPISASARDCGNAAPTGISRCSARERTCRSAMPP